MIDLSSAAGFVGVAFVDWLKLFLAPFKNFDMLWIIVPLWGVWAFSELFQEKKGTSFGNAITNGAIMLFVGVDWIRQVVRGVQSGTPFETDLVAKMAVSGVIIVISAAIIVLGIKGKNIVKYIGRVRASTYILLMFTPIIYGVVELSIRNLAIIACFFPAFYLFVAALDRWIPTPKTFELENDAKNLSSPIGNEGYLDLGNADFGNFGKKGKF